MTVDELISMLVAAEPTAIVRFDEKYGEDAPWDITGMEYNKTEVVLTNEDTS